MILVSAVALFALLGILLVAPVSGIVPPTPTPKPPTPTPTPKPPPDKCMTELIAGQHYTAGHVEVWEDGGYLHVLYVAGNGWSLGETHLYVGTTPPEKAAPGKFPYSGAYNMIPLDGLACGDLLYIAAHAVVSMDGKSETAWADSYGTLIRDKGWAMYFGYELCGGCFTP